MRWQAPALALIFVSAGAAACRDDEGWDTWTWVADDAGAGPSEDAGAGDATPDVKPAKDASSEDSGCNDDCVACHSCSDEACTSPGGDLGATTLGGGWNHVLVVDGAGVARSWGANEAGQLGQGDADVHFAPGVVAGGGAPFATLVGGSRHTCGVRVDGTLWCWGVNVHGQLGTEDTTDRHEPAQVGVDANWAEVACGGLHTCARRTDGSLWCWGANALGQVGIGDAPDQNAPRRVGEDFDWATLGAMTRHTCAVKASGTLWCWGDDSDGQLGQGDVGVARKMPAQVGTEATWRRVRTGALHTCAIDTGSALWCWGANDAGQLGLGDTTPRSVPVKLDATGPWVAVRGGFSHTCGLRDDGTLYCWGEDAKGQLANPDLAARTSPTRVGAETGWTAFATGQAHTCATRTGRVYCWGDDTWAQLAVPSNDDPNPDVARVCLPTTPP